MVREPIAENACHDVVWPARREANDEMDRTVRIVLRQRRRAGQRDNETGERTHPTFQITQHIIPPSRPGREAMPCRPGPNSDRGRCDAATVLFKVAIADLKLFNLAFLTVPAASATVSTKSGRAVRAPAFCGRNHVEDARRRSPQFSQIRDSGRCRSARDTCCRERDAYGL